MRKETLPKEVQEYIDRYEHLKIAGQDIVVPYYINLRGFLTDPVHGGKGTPEEIEAAANKLTAGMKNLGVEDIRTIMMENSIGLDCSGLIYHVLNHWLNQLGKGDLKDYLPRHSVWGIRKFLSRSLKPQSSVSADMLTSQPISKQVSVSEVHPGDLIRSRGGKHILLVTEVVYDNNVPTKIKFVNSTTYYKRNGLRYGEITLDDKFDLGSAHWNDNDISEPVNYAYKGYRELINNNGLFRPNLPLSGN